MKMFHISSGIVLFPHHMLFTGSCTLHISNAGLLVNNLAHKGKYQLKIKGAEPVSRCVSFVVVWTS